MLPKRTTIVLGAGASKAFGLPTGEELRSQIIELPRRAIRTEHSPIADDPGRLQGFVDAFRDSYTTSIDEFLGRRPELAEIGKQCIATVLLSQQRIKGLHNPDDYWFRYLWQRLGEDRFEDVNLGKLSIVTFNYDLSFETCLLSALRNSYARDEDAVLAKLRRMTIIHVYGSLGSPFPDDSNYIPFGSGLSRDHVARAASAINVVPEGRNASPAFDLAQQEILYSDAVVFLGFGFDRINLQRLQTEWTCGPFVNIGPRERRRSVVATALGLTPAEITKAASQLGTNGDGGRGTINTDAFHSCTCVEMMRRTLVLE